MSEAKIQLKKVNRSNYRDMFNLKVADNQTQFVASNATSLAQALFHPEAWYRGIYLGEQPIGFVMLDIDTQKPEYYLWRYMIDERYQRQGYGQLALELVIEHVKTLPDSTEFWLSYVPGEGNPRSFYEKFGFVDTGEIEDDEVVMKLSFK